MCGRRNPELCDDDGVEIPHLYDMLSALLDWDPTQRLGDATIQAHAYWGHSGAPIDWELADRGRMPSPMGPHLKVHESEGRQGTALNGKDRRIKRKSSTMGTDEASVAIARNLAMSQKKAALAEAAMDGDDHVGDKETEQLRTQAVEMHVDGWEFCSEHALAREYVISAADVISIV